MSNQGKLYMLANDGVVETAHSFTDDDVSSSIQLDDEIISLANAAVAANPDIGDGDGLAINIYLDDYRVRQYTLKTTESGVIAR